MIEPTSAYKVLVVEDEGLIAQDIARRLQSLGHHVLATVSTAEEAVKQAAGADLVLMDVHIDGDRDGIDAAIEIRARHRVPVLFLTAHSDRATLDRAKLAGPFAYLVKPVATGALYAAIDLASYRHRIERQIEGREAWYRATLDSTAAAIITVDATGRVRTINRAAESLAGWTSEQGVGRRLSGIARFVDERTGLEIGDPVAVALVRDAAVILPRGARLVVRSASADGSTAAADPGTSATFAQDAPARDIAVEGEAAPVKANGEILGAVLTLREAEFERWEEQQLRQTQRMEAAGRLAASVAADYGRLLASIRNQASHLLDQFSEYPPARRAAEEIHQAASTADRLTRRLAAFGTRQAGNPETVSLNRIVRNLAKPIESVARGRAQVALRLDHGAGQVHADPALIEQAIMNLVLHACAAAPQQELDPDDFTPAVLKLQRLSISTRRAHLPHRGQNAEFVALTLEYEASEPDLEHLFDPAPAGEAGLALPVAHAVVQEHGGFLTARSIRARGTCVEMLLPLASAGVPLPVNAEIPPTPLSVLLVDPLKEVRAELHKFFEAAGLNLMEAADGQEAAALAQLYEGPLDLVVADARVADNLLDAVRAVHPGIEALRIVDGPERLPFEIRRPFSAQALVERVRALRLAVVSEMAATATFS